MDFPFNPSTSPTLLERLRDRADKAAKDQFVDLYTSLILCWVKQRGVPPDEIDDAVQEVMLHLLNELPRFRYTPGRRFRGWLFTVVQNRLNDLWPNGRLPTVPVDPEDLTMPDPLDAQIEAEYLQHLAASAWRILTATFGERDVAIFLAHAVERRPAADVAREHDVSAEVVYQTCTRIARRLRQLLDGLLD